MVSNKVEKNIVTVIFEVEKFNNIKVLLAVMVIFVVGDLIGQQA